MSSAVAVPSRKLVLLGGLLAEAARFTPAEIKNLTKTKNSKAVDDIERELATATRANVASTRIFGLLYCLRTEAGLSTMDVRRAVLANPTLLLLDAAGAQARLAMLREVVQAEGSSSSSSEDDEAMSKRHIAPQEEDDVALAAKLATTLVTYPHLLTLGPAALVKLRYLVCSMGVPLAAVARTVRRRTNLLSRSEDRGFRQVAAFLTAELGLPPAAVARAVVKQPMLAAASVSSLRSKAAYFTGSSIGLTAVELAAAVAQHPSILLLSLDNIESTLRFLTGPFPSLAAASPSSPDDSSGSALPSRKGHDASERFTAPERLALAAAAAPAAAAVLASPSSGITPSAVNGTDATAAGPTATSAFRAITATTAALAPPVRDPESGDWSWGLGIDPRERSVIVGRAADLLWKSVSDNLAPTAAFFLLEAGLAPPQLARLAVRQPQLLSLSVADNLRPKLAFLCGELGLPRAQIPKALLGNPALLSLSLAGNLRPKAAMFRSELGATPAALAAAFAANSRIMNASATKRLAPRMTAMKERGMRPRFIHIGPLCTYPQPRFEAWLDREAPLSSPSSGASAAAADTAAAPVAAVTGAAGAAGVRAGVGAATLSGYTGDGNGGKGSGSGARLQEKGVEGPAVSAAAAAAAAVAPALTISAQQPSATTTVESGVTYALAVGRGRGAARASASGAAAIPFAPGRAAAREMVRDVCAGLRVLDLFSGTGGFALGAAAGGAAAVTAVERSGPLAALARRNAHLNGAEGVVTVLRADATSFANEMRLQRTVFDLVVLDPPAPAQRSPSRATAGAVNRFKTLVTLALGAVAADGGMFVAVNALFASDAALIGAVADAAKTAGRAATPVHIASPATARPATDGQVPWSAADATSSGRRISAASAVRSSRRIAATAAATAAAGSPMAPMPPQLPPPPRAVLFVCSGPAEAPPR